MKSDQHVNDPLEEAKRFLMQVSPRPSMVAISGKGSWLTDHAGTAYLDFVQGRGTNALGHCAPELSRAVTMQASTMVNPGSHLYSDQGLQLAKVLAQTSGLDQVFFANSGTEANEAAIKLARKWGRLNGRENPEILVFHDAFHGRSMGSMSASVRPAWDRWFGPLAPGFRAVPFNDLAAVAQAFSPQVAAVLVEPVQGEAGVVLGTQYFLQGLRELCDRNGALLILDEVQTGIGRLGSLFAFQHYGVRPDIVTAGKGLGNGFPISAVLATEAVCVFEHGEHGGTFNGGPLACSVALATLATVDSKPFLNDVRTKGTQLGLRLHSLGEALRCGGAAGIGLMWRMELNQPIASAVVRYAMDGLRADPGWECRGLLLNAPRPNILRFLPALNVSTDEIDLMVDGLRRSIIRVREAGVA
ncbi:aspartate aminotransferase family protein [Comamonas squillarum]|uniref:aspartate aminotransferase family protein n=1 Tax=Comamonas squillarum TaxID=2977320 RepID=UPI00391FB6F4